MPDFSSYDVAQVEGPFDKLGNFSIMSRWSWYALYGWLNTFNDFSWVEFAGAEGIVGGQVVFKRRSYPEYPWLGGDPT